MFAGVLRLAQIKQHRRRRRTHSSSEHTHTHENRIAHRERVCVLIHAGRESVISALSASDDNLICMWPASAPNDALRRRGRIFSSDSAFGNFSSREIRIIDDGVAGEWGEKSQFAYRSARLYFENMCSELIKHTTPMQIEFENVCKSHQISCYIWLALWAPALLLASIN
jgi:hypothetical protein